MKRINYRKGFEELLKHEINGKTIEQQAMDEAVRVKENQRELQGAENYPSGPIESIVKVIATRSYGRLFATNANKLDAVKIRYTLEYLESDESQEKLTSIAKRGWVRDNVNEFLKQLRESGSVKRWLNERKQYAENHDKDLLLKRIGGVGLKGRDNLLRDCGYVRRVPIDVHQKRFMLRTGIFHEFSPDKADPVERYEDFHDTFVNFCSSELKGILIAGFDLGDSPGIADFAVWHFCRKGNICGAEPKCNQCGLRGISCLFATWHDLN